MTLPELAEAVRSIRTAKTREEAAAIEWTILHGISLLQTELKEAKERSNCLVCASQSFALEEMARISGATPSDRRESMNDFFTDVVAWMKAHEPKPPEPAADYYGGTD